MGQCRNFELRSHCALVEKVGALDLADLDLNPRPGAYKRESGKVGCENLGQVTKLCGFNFFIWKKESCKTCLVPT